MSKETLKPTTEKSATQVFYLPELGVSVEASSIEEAIKKTTKGDQKHDS